MLGQIIGGLAGGLLGGKGGSSSQTASKDPWAPVQPWLQSLIGQGQDLSDYYSATPFNPAQIQAYGNMANQGAYMRSLVPGLLSQVSGNPIAYDPGNPSARPQAFNFGLLGGGQSPNLGLLTGGGAQNPVNAMPANMPKAVAPAAAPTGWSPAPGMTGFMGYDLFNRDYSGAGA